jgi:hypothetical protein
MDHKTWTTMDKSTWGDGPWSAEVDKEQFSDEATGLPCLIKRSPLGALCGYVGVSEGHPWFGQGYDDVRVAIDGPPDYPEVHGGLTFAGFCQEGPEDKTVCHIPGPGEPDRVWWLGFDCAHAFDLSPAMRARERESYPPSLLDMREDLGMRETYKDIGYVKDQCTLLALQAQAARVTQTTG